MTTDELYEAFAERMRTLADLRFSAALLQWDQETYLPAKGARFRGRQLTTLAELAHLHFTDVTLGGLIDDLRGRGDLTEDQRINVQRTAEDRDRSLRYPPSLVRALAEATHEAFHAWMEARKENDFGRFAPALRKMVDLKREESAVLGGGAHPYDPLLNEYERGATTSLLDRTFSDLLPRLKAIREAISGAQQGDDGFLKRHYPKKEQWEWTMELISGLGYDLEAGRQDLSEHPFSVSFSPEDVRITTRVDEQDFGNATWSCIHEVGHALYEQGLPVEQYGLPLGEACSYSMHESQSRLWENNVGRGLSFWKHWYPQLQARFPGQLGEVPLEAFYRGINRVQPSLIRTEADEVTYHFHVFIRYRLEVALMEGSLEVEGIPAAWNALYKQWLGVTVPDDRQGCLQDVHWSHGSFGYFPTYSLGSLYAAQLFSAAGAALPGLDGALERGQTAPLLAWLRREVHSEGRRLKSEELCQKVTGRTLDASVFTDYLAGKYGPLNNLIL